MESYQVPVNNTPQETVSSIQFNPVSNLFAVGSWDNSITCYKYNMNMPLMPTNDSSTTSISVRNIPSSVADNKHLLSLFKPSGGISAKITPGNYRSFGIVEFETTDKARLAANSLNNYLGMSCALNCDDKQLNKNATSIIGTKYHKRGVLCCCWNNHGNILFSGGCDNELNLWNIDRPNLSLKTLGNHQSSIKCMKYSNKYNILLTASWDKTIKCWDIRSESEKHLFSKASISKIYCMSHKGNAVVIGVHGGIVEYYDLRYFSQPISSTKIGVISRRTTTEYFMQQIRDIDIFPDKRGYVATLMEGRCAVQHFNAIDETRDFTYKCHQNTSQLTGKRNVYSVNVVKFHQTSNTFITGGDDGGLIAWDKNKRQLLKRLVDTRRIGHTHDCMPITAVDFCRNGGIMAMAKSYNGYKGSLAFYDGFKKPQIYLVKVKSKHFANIFT